MLIEIKRGNQLSQNDIINIVEILKIDSSSDSKKKVDSQYLQKKLIENVVGSYSVLATINGRLIGFLSFTGKLLEKSLVFELGDVIVSPDGRGKAVFFRMLRRFHKEYPSVSCYGTPNEAALPHELKAGYQLSRKSIDYRITLCRLPISKIFSKFSLAKLGTALESLFNLPLAVFSPLNEIKVHEIEDFSSLNCMLDGDKRQLEWRLNLNAANYRCFASGSTFFIVNTFYERGFSIAYVVLTSRHHFWHYLRLKAALNKIGVNFIVEMSGSESRLRSIASYRLRRVPFIYIGPYQNYKIENFSGFDGDNV